MVVAVGRWFLALFTVLVLLSVKAVAAPSSQLALQNLAEHLRSISPSQLSSLQWLDANDPLLQATRRQSLTMTLSNGDSIKLRRQMIKSPLTGVVSVVFSSAKTDTMLRYSQKGEAATGTYTHAGERWKVVIMGDHGFRYLASELPSVNQSFGDDAVIPPAAKKLSPQQMPPTPKESFSNDTDTPVTADVVATYSTALIDVYGSEDAVLARIADVFATTNQAYADSGVPLQVNLLDTIAVDFDPDTELASSTVLDMVAGFNGDVELFSHVREQTERLGADFSAMFRPYANDGNCGIAYLSGKDDSRYIPRNMVSHTSLNCSDIVTAHELGHNMGLNHSRRQDGSGYVYPYALGYGEDGNFVTIMAYPQSFNTGVRLNKFSSPQLDCQGSPCGVSHENQQSGADAVRALTLRAQQIGSVRQRQTVSGELVAVTVIGQGSVRYDGQTCTNDEVCRIEVATGTTLSLLAEASAGSVFDGWRGACAASSGLTCEITATGTTNVIVDFATQYTELDLTDVVENSELVFETTAGAPWTVVDDNADTGTTSVRAASIGNNAASVLRTRVDEAGELSFAAKISSERGYDKLIISVNGKTVQELSGEEDWQSYALTINQDGSEYYTVEFRYSKDGTEQRGDDTAWLDNIQFVPSGEPTEKTVSLQVVGNGWINAPFGQCSGSCSVQTSGGLLNLSAIAFNEDNGFIGWGGACSGQTPECTVEVTDDVTIFAYFEQDYTATADYNDALDNQQLAFITPERDWMVVDDAQADTSTVLKTPALERLEPTRLVSYVEGPGSLSFAYKIMASTERAGFNLKVDGNIILEDSGTMSWQRIASVSIPEGYHEISWEFFHDTEDAAADNRLLIDNVGWTGESPTFVTLDLATMGDAGAVRVEDSFMCRGECRQSVPQRQARLLTAQPDNGAEFVRWEGDCSGQQLTCQVSLDTDTQVTALFSIEQYTVTGTSNSGGVITPERKTVKKGERVTFNLVALAGHKLSSVSGCAVERLDALVYRSEPITSDCEVTATFEPLQYEVNFDLGLHGLYQDGALRQLVDWGEPAQAPDFSVVEGWHFAAWSSDFSSIKNDLTVAAIYQQIDGNNRVDITLGSGGRMNQQPLQYIADGESLTVTLHPQPGYRVQRQVGGNCPAGEWQKNVYQTGSITADCQLTLGFKRVTESGSLLLILSSQADEENEQ